MRRFLDVLRRAAPVRLLLLGFPLLLGLGLTLAFHHEYAKGALFAYSAPVDWALTLAACATLLVVYALLVRGLERRWPDELALRGAGRWLGRGALTGFALFTAVLAGFALLGLLDWQWRDPQAAVGPLLLLAVVAGVGEELLFRGVLFRVLEGSVGTFGAVLLSAALFGLSHAGNPGATTWSSVAIALEAGVMLALAYAWSRNLWFVIGLHAAWNFTQGGIYGAPVSGQQAEAHGLFAFELAADAPAWLTGGGFGPEASIVAVAVCVAATAWFALRLRGQERWVPLRLRLTAPG